MCKFIEIVRFYFGLTKQINFYLKKTVVILNKFLYINVL